MRLTDDYIFITNKQQLAENLLSVLLDCARHNKFSLNE